MTTSDIETMVAASPGRKLLLDRIKDAINEPEELSEPPEELVQWSTTTFYSGVVTFFAAGLIGAKNAAEAHIEANKSTVYQNQVHAQREVNYAAARGFIKTGSKWGLEMMAFTGIFTGIYLYLQDLRDRKDFVNAGASGAVTGGLMGLKNGVKAIPRGTMLGATLGTIGGAAMQAVWWLENQVDTPEIKLNRERAKQLERAEKRRKYEEKLHVTSTILKGLEAHLEEHEAWEKRKA